TCPTFHALPRRPQRRTARPSPTASDRSWTRRSGCGSSTRARSGNSDVKEAQPPRKSPTVDRSDADGRATTCMSELAAVDANVLVYRYDPRDAEKQKRASELLRRGANDGSLVVPYQAIVEFVSATVRPRREGKPPLLPARDAWREAQDFADIYEIVYPDAETVPAAVALAAVHALSWYDALILAYVECRGLTTLYSEDFED